MGYDAACTLHLDGRATRGTALLEQHDLIFRGPFRLAIPLSQIASATAEDGPDGALRRRTATFELGRRPPKWAKRITNPPSRLDKLGIKAGMTVLFVACADQSFAAEMKARGAKVVQARRRARRDSYFYGAETRAGARAARALPASISRTGESGSSGRRGSRRLPRRTSWRPGNKPASWTSKVVSFSETHYAPRDFCVTPRRERRGHHCEGPLRTRIPGA